MYFYPSVAPEEAPLLQNQLSLLLVIQSAGLVISLLLTHTAMVPTWGQSPKLS